LQREEVIDSLEEEKPFMVHMKLYLYIDTIERDTLEVALISESLEVLCAKKYIGKTDRLLPLIFALCQKNQCSPHDFTGICIRHVKSAAFTSVRIGMVVANAFSYFLRIPVYEVKSAASLDLSEPAMGTLGFYACEPHITAPKFSA